MTIISTLLELISSPRNHRSFSPALPSRKSSQTSSLRRKSMPQNSPYNSAKGTEHLFNRNVNPCAEVPSNISSSSPLVGLPNEIVVQILGYLDSRDIVSFSCTCTSLFEVSCYKGLWKNLFFEHFKFTKPHRPQHYSHPSKKLKYDDMCNNGANSNWRDIYKQRYIVEANWRKGRCETSTLQGHQEPVWGIQFSGDTLVSGSEDGSLRVWDMHTKLCQRVLRGHADIVNSFHFEGDRVATGSDDCTVKLWDVNSGACMHTMAGHDASVWMLEFASGNFAHKLVSGSCDKDLRIWDLHTGQCDNVLRGHTGRIYYLQVRNNVIFSASQDKTLRAWDMRSGECTHTFTGASAVHCLQADKEGERVVCGFHDGGLGVYSLRTANGYRLCNKSSTPVWHVQFNGRHVVTPVDNSMHVWDLDKPTTMLGVGHNRVGVPLSPNQSPLTLKAHTKDIKYFQLKGNKLVSGSQDGTIRVWDMSKLDCSALARINGGTSGAEDEGSVCTLKGHTDSVDWLEFKTRTMVSCSKDCSIKIWSFK